MQVDLSRSHSPGSRPVRSRTGSAPARSLLLILCALAAGCASAPGRPVDPSVTDALARVEGRFGVDQIAAAARSADVLFLGEEHGNNEGHRLQLAVIDALRNRGADVVVSMEMFERDVQPVLDAYLCGRIDEERFLAGSRPWPGYKAQYRPVVEYARAHGLPVIAANVPRDLARKVSQQGLDAMAVDPNMARATSAPRDAYWQAFIDAMKGHMGNNGEDALYRMYQAQCLKDDTMAESIVAARAAAPRRGDRPLVVVHLNGKFHSDHRLGTAARVIDREPDLRVVVVSMRSTGEVSGRGVVRGEPVADFTWLVAAEPRRVLPAPRVPAQKPAEVSPVAEVKETDPGSDPEPSERPALGIMPDYDAVEKGLAIASVTEGGAAETAGLKDGDIITTIDGREVEDVRSYMQVMAGLQVGKTVPIEVLRDGKPAIFNVKIGARRQ